MNLRRLISKIMVIVLLAGIMAVTGLSYAVAKVDEYKSADKISDGILELGSGNTGKVVLQFDIICIAEIQESIIGVCDSSASPESETDFPIALKLSTDGLFRVLKDKEYVYDHLAFYEGDVDYVNDVMMVIDLNAQKYDVFFTPSGLSPVLLAEGCSFRSGVSIDDIGKICLYSTDGTAPKSGLFKIRNVSVVPYEVPEGQWRSAFSQVDPERGSYSLGTGNTGVVTTEFDVIFNSHGGGILYLGSDMMVRHWIAPIIININTTNGYFQARNGDKYAKINNVPYEIGKKAHVKTVIDLEAKTYDCFVNDIQIADDFAFRSDAPEMKDVGKIHVKGSSNQVFVENHRISSTNGGESSGETDASTAVTTAATTDGTQAIPASEPAETRSNSGSTGTTIILLVVLAVVIGVVGFILVKRKK